MISDIKRIEEVRKTLDIVAYASLVLDICIAVVTTLSIFKVGDPQAILVPINYMLTAVVVLSIALFVTLLVLKYERGVLISFTNRKYKFRYKKK